MLDYPALQALSAVVREGSFERAATALRITPSAVSQRVRGLEERLGAVLVVRGAPCLPTDVGRALCAHVDRVHLLEADLGIDGAAAGAPTVLKIAVNADSLATWLPPALAGFGRSGDVTLDLTLDDEAHTAERLRSGEVVAAVTADPEPVQGCRTLALGRLVYAACASPDYCARYFPRGVVDERTLARAPKLRFDRRERAPDPLDARGARLRAGRADALGALDARLPRPRAGGPRLGPSAGLAGRDASWCRPARRAAAEPAHRRSPVLDRLAPSSASLHRLTEAVRAAAAALA